MATRIDTVHQQRQREFIVSLLCAYGCTMDLTRLDNRALIVALEKALCGVTK